MILYRIIFPNGKSYAGITSRGLSYRRNGHKQSWLNGVDNKLYRAFTKYGWDSAAWEVVSEFDSFDEACKAEVAYIANHDLIKSGYNITAGGQGCPGRKNTPEQTARHSTSQKTRFSKTEEREKTSAKQKEWVEKNPELHRLSREKAANTLRTKEFRDLASQKQKEFIEKTPEWRALHGERMKAVMTCEKRIEISRKLGGTPIEALKDGIYVSTFQSIHECSRALGVGLGNISSCLAGRRQRAGGYEFRRCTG